VRSTLLSLSLSALVSLGCAEVPSYARGPLAHPTMAPDFSESAARDHREAVQEGATGGTVGAVTGCGCN